MKKTKFIVIHDDEHARTQSEEDIRYELDESKLWYKLKPMSTDKEGMLNMFYLEIEGEYESWKEFPQALMIINDVWYYEVHKGYYIPIDKECNEYY